MNSLPLELECVFKGDILFAGGAPIVDPSCLFATEHEYIKHAVNKRQAEFGAARIYARQALSRLGIAPCPLVPYPDRSPRWPDNVVGSITHTDTYCLVGATSHKIVLGIGIDVEGGPGLPSALEDLVCTPRERHLLADCDLSKREQLAMLLFSAKEAFYKCVYPRRKLTLDFLDIGLSLNLATQTFETEWNDSWRLLDLKGARIEGRFWIVDKFVITIVIWRE